MLYQQCLNRLSKVQGTTITEEALLEVPGFSEFVLSQIQNRMDYPPRKRKADESVPSNKKKEVFLREFRLIGKLLPHIEKALLGRFKSNEDLKTSLQMQATREGKENMLR